MKVAQIQFMDWDKSYNFDISGFDLKVNDQVVTKTDVGVDIGKAIKIIDNFSVGANDIEIKPILRKVTTEDLNRLGELESERKAAIEYCKKATDKYGLPMKIVNVHFSLDGGRITFAFIADGRIDFRQMVKDLTHYFQKSIRLHQLGIRDEAKMVGDVGPCGRNICCRSHLRSLASITSEMAEAQQVAHRGSDRLSGMCGRLRCCLAYEREEYERLAAKIPAVGTAVRTQKGRGVVVNRHILKQTVEVAINGDESNILEIAIH